MAWIEQRGDGWSVCYRDRGRRERVSGLPSERAAQALADEIDRVHARGQVYERTRRAAPRWDELADEYVTWAASRSAPTTMRSVCASLDRFGTWGAARTRRAELWADEVDVEVLEDWHAAMLAEGLSTTYARQSVSRVRRALRWGASRPGWRGVLVAPDMPYLLPASTRVGSESPAWDDCDRAIAQAAGWVQQAMVVGRATGLRLAQVMYLKREDLDLGTATLHIPPGLPGSKTRSERRGRWVPVPAWLVEDVASWGPWSGWLVDRRQRARSQGPAFDPEARDVASSTFRAAWERAGVEVAQPFHALRKSHYTGLLLAGVPDAHVDALQGRAARTLGGSTYADWRRLVEPVLRPAVAHVPRVRYDLPPLRPRDASAPSVPPLPPRGERDDDATTQI